jgi:molybdate transport system ATP-binding protein
MTLDAAFTHRFSDRAFDIRFSAPTPGTTVLFGRSGSGKSTVVAAVAGLLRPSGACRIALDGAALADSAAGIFLPPERRRVGMVFQDARLFPHMSVATNLRYGLRRARAAPDAPAIRFDDVVELLGIRNLLERKPRTLSGGERQRAAIGRALLAQPRLLAMDEPLASLDAQRKAEILPYLARLGPALGLPILYVTHALDEVARLADTLVLIRAGKVLASGTLSEVAARGDLPLAERDDAGAVLPATVAAHDRARRLTTLHAAGRDFLAPLLDVPEGGAVRLRIPAREVALATAAPPAISIHNVIPGTVRAVTDDPDRHAANVEIALDGAAMLARVTPDAVARLGLGPGAPVLALVKSVALEVLA